MEGIISIFFNVIILVFLFFGALWGFIRGLRKTSSRAIFLLLTAIITIFVTPLVTKFILNIGTTVTVMDNESKVVPLSESFSFMIDEIVGYKLTQNYPILRDILINIPRAIINVLVFVAVFWVLKIFLYPLNFLFYRLTFAPKVKDKRLPKHRMLGALVGLASGLVVTFSTMVPFYGIMDIVSTANTIKINSDKDNEISLTKATSGATDKMVLAYETSATNLLTKYTGIKSLGLLVFDNLTIQNYGESSITLRKEVENIAQMTTSIDDFIKTLDNYKADENAITQEEIANVITKLKTVVSNTREVKMIDGLGDILIPAISGYIKENDLAITNNENVNKYILAMTSELSSNNNLNLFSEVNNILTFIEYINEQNLLAPIINNEFSNATEIFNSIDDEFVTNFNEKLFNIEIVDTCVPHVINIALSFATDAIDIEMDETTASSAEIKTDLNKLITKVVNFGKSIDTSSSSLISTNSIIPLGEMLDAVKDSVIITDVTYSNVLDYASVKLQDLTSEVIPEDIQNFFNNGMLKNLHNIDSWTNDLTTLNEGLNILRNKENGIIGEVQEGEDLRQGFSIDFKVEEAKLINFGKALDLLETTKLLGNKVDTTIDNQNYNISPIKMLFIDILNMANNTITENNMQKFENVVSDMKKNILNNTQTNAKFWQDEMEYTSPLIEEVYNMIDNNNVDITDTLGKNLDSARKSCLLGGTTTIGLVSTALDMAKENILGSNFEYEENVSLQTTNDKIYDLFTSIDEELHGNKIKNILTPGQATFDNNFWEKEFKSYNKLKDISNETENITSTQGAIDIADDLDYIFENSETIKKSKLSSIVACTIDQIKTDEIDGVKGEINTLLNKISSNLKSEEFFNDKDTTDFWTIELNYMNDLYNVEFDGDNVVSQLNTIGRSLDEVAIKGKTIDTGIENDPQTSEDESKKEYRKSCLIEEEDIRKILSKSIDEMKGNILNSFTEGIIKTTVETALRDIATNLSNTSIIKTISFENELTHLQTLANIEINPDAFKVVEIKDTDTPEEKAVKEELIANNSSSLVKIGEDLDSIGHHVVNEIGLIKYSTNNDYTTYEYTNSRIITREIISNLIVGIFDVAKNTANTQIEDNMDDVDDADKIKVAFDNTIIRIENQIKNVTESHKVFSWARELSYITTLTNLNAGEEYDIDNTGDKLSTNLDTIAFNLKADNVTYLDIVHDAQGYITLMPEGEKTNSLFITREILKNSVKDLNSTISIEEINDKCKPIITDLINNLSSKVAGNTATANTSTHYSTFTKAFDDLKAVKDDITNKFDVFNTGLTLNDIILSGNASEYDNLLQGLQSKLVCHNITTRKVAILLLDELYNTMVILTSSLNDEYKFENIDTGKYIVKVKEHYTTVNNNQNANVIAERYHDTSKDTDTTNILEDFDNPFVRLTKLYQIPII